MARKEYEEKYTHPELREELLEEIKGSDKGGEPGQWSARKAQLLTQEYERRGGGYREGEKDERQESLTRWTEEEWQTKEGDERARGDGETKRYLPKRAWESMSEEEQEETDRRKREGSKEGRQYVENTQKAKEARKEAAQDGPGAPPIEGYDEMNVEEVKGRLDGLSGGELKEVRDYEEGHKARKTLLEPLDREIEKNT